MTSYFPDINVWLALSVDRHPHHTRAWAWWRSSSETILMSRFTQMGLLRLLSNPAVMGEEVLPIQDAWTLYEEWRDDPRLNLVSEPSSFDQPFRRALRPFEAKPSSKWIGDAYLLALAGEYESVLVTFDKQLHTHARRLGGATVHLK